MENLIDTIEKELKLLEERDLWNNGGKFEHIPKYVSDDTRMLSYIYELAKEVVKLRQMLTNEVK